MKTTNRFSIVVFTMLMLFSTTIFAQDEAPPEAKYYVVTTMHWNMDNDDFDMDEWKAVEGEFFEKVTNKNEHIIQASYYAHHTSPDNSELLYIQSFPSWEAIHKAGDRMGELIEEAWKDEEARKAFFEKQGAYYARQHSDEIYATTAGAKYFSEPPTEGMLLYIRRNHAAFPEDGSAKEWTELRDARNEMIKKNEHIKGYFPSAHYYGADSSERIQAFFVDSMEGLDKMYERNAELAKEAFPDEAARKERAKRAGKYVAGHGDSIYTYMLGSN